jgi:hypothetical protein
MKDFWVNFSGTMLIRNCENEEEAKERFFETLKNHNKNCDNEFQFCGIDDIKERF